MDEKEQAKRLIMQHMAFDTDRVWATQASVLLSGPVALLVFREQANVSFEEQPDEAAIDIAKNVASIVMPIEVAQELGALLKRVVGDPPPKEQKAEAK
jgi:hypothetical protein